MIEFDKNFKQIIELEYCVDKACTIDDLKEIIKVMLSGLTTHGYGIDCLIKQNRELLDFVLEANKEKSI